MSTKKVGEYEPSKAKLIEHRRVLWSTKTVPVYYERSTWKFFAFPDPADLENILTAETMNKLCDQLDGWDKTQNTKFVWHKEIWIVFVNDPKTFRFDLHVVDVGTHPLISIRYKNQPNGYYSKTTKIPYSPVAESTLRAYLKTLNSDVDRIVSEDSIRMAFPLVFGEKRPVSKRFKNLEMD
jgi:hypothetical protein